MRGEDVSPCFHLCLSHCKERREGGRGTHIILGVGAPVGPGAGVAAAVAEGGFGAVGGDLDFEGPSCGEVEEFAGGWGVFVALSYARVWREAGEGAW